MQEVGFHSQELFLGAISVKKMGWGGIWPRYGYSNKLTWEELAGAADGVINST